MSEDGSGSQNVLVLTPAKEDDGAQYTCQVNGAADPVGSGYFGRIWTLIRFFTRRSDLYPVFLCTVGSGYLFFKNRSISGRIHKLNALECQKENLLDEKYEN